MLFRKKVKEEKQVNVMKIVIIVAAISAAVAAIVTALMIWKKKRQEELCEEDLDVLLDDETLEALNEEANNVVEPTLEETEA